MTSTDNPLSGPPALILASGSTARRSMLQAAGLHFSVQAADIDEAALTRNLLQNGRGPSVIAAELAHAKAAQIAAKNPGAWVIGADQMLTMDGQILDKAPSQARALETLRALSGRTHRLISAACLVCGQEILWQATQDAELDMRPLDEAFLQQYARAAGPALLRSVGAYELEGAGAWLFSEVRGDYFAVLGMPLLPLLGFLRASGAMGP